MLEILLNTPRWVYAVFAFITYTGVRACFESRLSVPELLVLPCAFGALAVFDALDIAALSITVISVHTVALVTGAVLAYRRYRTLAIGLSDDRRALRVSGDILVLSVSMSFFAVRYWDGYQSAIGAPIAQKLPVELFIVATSSFVSGFFAARSATLFLIFRQLSQAPLVGESEGNSRTS